MISLQVDDDTEAALALLTATGGNRSSAVRQAILQAAGGQPPPQHPGIDRRAAARASKAILELLNLTVTAVDAQDATLATEMIRVTENRLRWWREARQTPDEQMDAALGHVLGVMEGLKPKHRAVVMAKAIERMQERFA